MAMCLKCNVLEDDSDSLTKCDSCQRSIHKRVCSGLNASEVKVVELKGKRLLKFYCENCTEGLLCIPKLLKAIDELRTEVATLKSDLGPSHQTPVQPNLQPAFQGDDIFAELQQRQARANNVMIFNVPEGDNDRNTAQLLISELAGNQTNVVNAVRIGKRNKNGARSLKVTLPHPGDVQTILTNKSKLRGRKIFITADLTPKQRAAEQEVRNDLVRRREAGEHDLILKYVRGTPVITTKKN